MAILCPTRCPSCGGICGWTKKKGCQYGTPAELYRRRNPMGGVAKVFDMVANRIRAGEPVEDVMDDYLLQWKTPTVSEQPEHHLRMTVDEALNWADEWAKGRTFYPDAQGWCVVCVVLAKEVRRLRESGKGAA